MRVGERGGDKEQGGEGAAEEGGLNWVGTHNWRVR